MMNMGGPMGQLAAEREYSVHLDETLEGRRARCDEDEDGNPIAHTHHTEEDFETAPPPIIRSKGNTGVKGVLADAARAREGERIEREIQAMKIQHKLQKTVITCDPRRDVPQTKEEEEPEELLEEDDDDFFEEYRKKQLEKFQGRRTFGFLASVNQEEFVPAIDDEPPNVYVIVHYYEDWHPSCVKINRQLATLAIKFPYTKFIRICSKEASETFEEVALPAISIYRAGKLISAELRVNEQLPPSFDSDHLQDFLAKFDCVEPSS